jgi:hypothetical protein
MLSAFMMNKKQGLYLTLVIFIVTAIFYFANVDKIRGDAFFRIDALPTRVQLQEKFFSDRRALLVYGASDPAYANQYRQFAEDFKTRSRWIKVDVQSDRETSEEDLQNMTVLLLGTTRSNQVLDRMGEKIPVRFKNDGFEFNEKQYRDSTDIITLFYPNPANPQYAVNIISGNSDEHILNSLESAFWGMVGDYRILRNQRCLVFGLFSQDDSTLWQFDPVNHRNFEAERSSETETLHYRFHLHGMKLNSKELQQITIRREEAIREIQDFLQVEDPGLPLIDYHIYPGIEDKGLITGNTRLSHFEYKQNAVHTVISPDIQGDDFARAATLILRRRQGKPQQDVLELGLSVYFSRNWRSKGWLYWASCLYLSENMVPLHDLLDNQQLNRESNLVMEPLAASFVAFLIETWGKEKFIKSYHSWKVSPGQIREMEEGWHTYLKQLSIKYKDQIAKNRAEFPIPKGFQKGFCHAHEGYDIYNGYASQKSDQALAKLAEVGTNYVSITPFSYMRQPDQPAFFPHSRNAGSETDESIIHASNSAKKSGMSVLLKPHIWLGRSWPGEIEMKTGADWEKFFEYYYRWMLHYALLAEIYKIEILCIGVELSKAAIGQENHWIKLIGSLRKLYSGKLIYAANWGEEFENLQFWDRLDYIGINYYYPLSSSDDASREELKAGMKTVLKNIEKVHQRYQKPVILTEVGFTSTPAPWKQPHEEAGRKPVNLEHQAKCYQIVFESIYKKEWIGGIYWWKWPSYLEYGGVHNNDFTPNGKLAEKVVADWFHKTWD